MRALGYLVFTVALLIPGGPSAGSTGSSPEKATPAARTTLEKVKAQGYVQCGSAGRPGLAMTDGKGEWHGLEVEICRAIAVAVFGPSAHYAYHRYEADKDYDFVRDGRDHVSFLSLSEMVDHKVADKLSPGPTVFVETHDILVGVDSSARKAADLRMSTICFIATSAPNSSLDAWYEERKIPLIRFAFREDGEMYDAYEVQRCKAVVGEATELARERLHGGVNHLKSRFLPDHLAAFPIVAATPLKDDGQWAAIVGWTVHTLMAAEAKETYLRGGGLRIIPVDGEGLGLAKDWQKTVVDAVGTYDAIFRRTLGADSPLKLERGLNAPLAGAGILLPPFEE